MKKMLFALTLSFLFAGPAFAQGQLTQAEVEAAVARGNTEDLNDIGISKTVGSGRRFGVSMARALNPDNNFVWPVVAAYTPATWIARNAVQASREYREFKVGNVTADMKKPVLRLFANDPYLVTAMVIKSVDGSQVARPAQVLNTCNTIEGANMMTFVPRSGQPFVSCAQYQFNMADLERVQNGDGEFLIVAITPASEESIKVGKKDLKKLF